MAETKTLGKGLTPLHEGVRSTGASPVVSTRRTRSQADTLLGVATSSAPVQLKRRQRIYPVGRTTKWVTREIAALDFLLNIPMQNEAVILNEAPDSFSPLSSSLRGAADFRATFSNSDEWKVGAGGEEKATSRQDRRVRDLPSPLGEAGRDPGAAVLPRDGQAAGGASNEDEDNTDAGRLDQPRPGGASSRARSGSSVAPTVPAPGGRRLEGPEPRHVRVPAEFRHRMERLPGHNAAVVKQWEQRLTNQEALLEGRLFFSCSGGYPLAVASVLRYHPGVEEAKRQRQKWIDERGAEAFQIPTRDWRGYSYAHLLRHGRARPARRGSDAPNAAAAAAAGDAGASAGGGEPGGGGGGDESDDAGSRKGGISRSGDEPTYQPGFLDDPEMTTGKHRHLMRGDQKTGPVVSSVLLFVKPQDLKDGLNKQFREAHPDLPPSLTLSKIRSVKRQALAGCHRAGLEVATVALACTYFERLCLKGIVTKPNRRLTMATCLVLAYKFNEPTLSEGLLPALWAFVDQEWQVSKKEVLRAEFGVLVQLSFSLHEDPRVVSYHFTRLLKMINFSPHEYLGEDMLAMQQHAITLFYDTREGPTPSPRGPRGPSDSISPRQGAVGPPPGLGAPGPPGGDALMTPRLGTQALGELGGMLRAPLPAAGGTAVGGKSGKKAPAMEKGLERLQQARQELRQARQELGKGVQQAREAVLQLPQRLRESKRRRMQTPRDMP